MKNMFELSKDRLFLNDDIKTSEFVLISRLMKNINRMYEYHFGFFYDYQKYSGKEKNEAIYYSLINIYNLVHLTVMRLGFDVEKFLQDAENKLNEKKVEFERKDSVFERCQNCVAVEKDVHGNLYCHEKKEYIVNIKDFNYCIAEQKK